MKTKILTIVSMLIGLSSCGIYSQYTYNTRQEFEDGIYSDDVEIETSYAGVNGSKSGYYYKDSLGKIKYYSNWV